MGDILKWPRHKRMSCEHSQDDFSPYERCGYCMGGLFLCSTCGAAEGELTTECPGYRVHEDERAAVMNGHLDYKRGRWICVSLEANKPLSF